MFVAWQWQWCRLLVFDSGVCFWCICMQEWQAVADMVLHGCTCIWRLCKLVEHLPTDNWMCAIYLYGCSFDTEASEFSHLTSLWHNSMAFVLLHHRIFSVSMLWWVRGQAALCIIYVVRSFHLAVFRVSMQWWGYCRASAAGLHNTVALIAWHFIHMSIC